MECSMFGSSWRRRWGWSCVALAFLALMLAAAPVPVRGQDPAQYSVGGLAANPNWFPHQQDPTFYQDWADSLTLYVNDSLLFQMDSTNHDVTQVWTRSDLANCSIADIALNVTNVAGVVLVLEDAGMFYLTSKGNTTTNTSSDCVQGMRFTATVQSRNSLPPVRQYSVDNSPVPSPAPPTLVVDNSPVPIYTTIEWKYQSDPNYYEHIFSSNPLGNPSAIAFNFKVNESNVLWVSQSDFDSCNVSSQPLGNFSVPNTIIPLGAHGDTYYYIDGIGDNCENGYMKLKVQLQVGDGSPEPGSSPSPSSGRGEQRKKFPLTVVIATFVSIISLLVLVLLAIAFRHCRRQYGFIPRGRYPERRVLTSEEVRKAHYASAAIDGLLKGHASGLRAAFTVFTYDELKRATKCFSADNEVGRGGFGTVYKGTLDDGTTVAIKMAKHASHVESFVNEVAILSQLNNRNLVKLLGCCVEADVDPLLVYEFIPNGNLQDHLSIAQKGFQTRLDWKARFKIAIQTAEALKYLHVQATPQIVHRDVKSANILLDDHLNAKVADFGLSKLVDLETTHVSTLVKGTPGYLDPEYFHNFQLTDKADVYSFGVVLLELITSKKPIDLSNPVGEQNLAVWSIPFIKSGRVREIIDSSVSSSLSREEFQAVEAVAGVAVACLVLSRSSRPSMSQVVEMLQRIKGSNLKAEEFFNKVDLLHTDLRTSEMQAHGISFGDSESTTTRSSGWDSEVLQTR